MLAAAWLLMKLATSPQAPNHEQQDKAMIEQIAQSGRCADLAETPDERVSRKPQIAPGPSPVLSFRFYEGKLHHRFGNSELLLDDAGH